MATSAVSQVKLMTMVAAIKVSVENVFTQQDAMRRANDDIEMRREEKRREHEVAGLNDMEVE